MGWRLWLLLASAAARLNGGPVDQDVSFVQRTASSNAVRHKAGVTNAHSAKQDNKDGVWYLNEMLDRFSNYAITTDHSVVERHQTENARLENAVGATQDDLSKIALQQSITSNQESLQETELVFTEMEKFIGTMKGVIGQVPMDGTGKGCADIQCGPHASCTRSMSGAECICDEGYEGDGMTCNAPAMFTPTRLLHDGMHGRSHQAADLSVAEFMGSKLAVVFRDVSNGMVGKIIIGDYTSGHVEWGPPEKFTDGQAYSPMVAGHPTNRISIAFRDADREASLFVLGGELGATGIRGADKHISWGEPMTIARAQAHQAQLLALGDDKTMVLYKDYHAATKDAAARHFCAASLMTVGNLGALVESGTFHFIEFAATRLTATLLSPTSFVIGYRGSKHVDDMDSSIVRRQEASAIYGQLADAELIFDPHPLDLEPSNTNIWARGLSKLGENTIGYAYLSGLDQNTHLAVIHVDPATHHMQVMSRQVLSVGFSPFVGMVSTPYSPEDPHTFTYFERGDQNMAHVCKVDLHSGALDRCEEMMYMDRKIDSISSVSIGAGRSLFTFADEAGVPYYQVIGLSKK